MAKKRVGISIKTRFEIFKRDGFTCQYCGATPPKAILHVDHINPVANGGVNDQDNLVTSCDICNMGKGARLLGDVPASLADRAALVAEREAQLRGYNEIMAARRERLEEQCWTVADIFIEQHSLEGIRKDWFQSIKKFIDLLGVDACIDAMQIATAKKPWSKNTCFLYFCGICWRLVRGETLS